MLLDSAHSLGLSRSGECIEVVPPVSLQLLTMNSFESWAREVGLVDHQVELEEHLKGDKMTYAVIVEALGHFANLLTKYSDFEKKYGLKPSVVDGKNQWFRSANQPVDPVDDPVDIPTISVFWSPQSESTFRDALLIFQKRIGYMKKLTWAIKDKAQFQHLVNTLRSLNDGLTNSLPRIKQNALERALIGGQPSDTLALRLLIQHQAISNDYVAAALFRRKALEQRPAQTALSNDQTTVAPQADNSQLVIESEAFSPRGRKDERFIGQLTQGTTTQIQKVFVEHKVVQKEDSIFFKRFLLLVDLLRTSPKPAGYRILDCQGYVRDDFRFEERYALIFKVPPMFTSSSDMSFYTLHELLRSKDDEITPLEYPLAERYRLAGLLANSISYIHFAGWLHRGLESRSIVCFSTANEKSVRHPYLSGFGYTRPDNPGEISQNDMSTTSNLYRHPDYQLPSPTKKFRRSYEIYSLGVVLLEIGLWRRISSFKKQEHTSPLVFAEHLRKSIVPLLGFYVGEVYRDAVSKCLDASLHGCGEDEGYRLTSSFSKQVVEALEGCYIFG